MRRHAEHIMGFVHHNTVIVDVKHRDRLSSMVDQCADTLAIGKVLRLCFFRVHGWVSFISLPLSQRSRGELDEWHQQSRMPILMLGLH